MRAPRFSKLVFDATRLLDSRGWYDCRDYILAPTKRAALLPILEALKSPVNGRGPEVRVGLYPIVTLEKQVLNLIGNLV
jgi:hypothetical protein